MAEAQGPDTALARRETNTLDGCFYWGLRLQYDTPQFPGTEEYVQVYDGDIGAADMDAGHPNTGNALYSASGERFRLRAVDAVPSEGEYANDLFEVTSASPLRPGAVDLFNGDSAATTGPAINGLLRQLLRPSAMRTKTWRIIDTGDFSSQAVEENPAYFETEQMLVKAHVYLLHEGRYIDVCKLDATGDISKVTGDSKSDYEKWRKMGEQRPGSESQNVLERGLNHAIVVISVKDDGTPYVEEAYLDGDRMVIDSRCPAGVRRPRGQRMVPMPGGTMRLLFSNQLQGPVVCPPLFWPLSGVAPVVCATRRRDPGKGGDVTVIRMYDLAGQSFGSRDLRGIELHAGSNLGAGDLDGDGRDELMAVDGDGRVHALNGSSVPLPGFPTQPSRSRILLGPPLVGDFNGDGKRELLCISAGSLTNSAESALLLFDAAGKALEGTPLRLDPPAATGPLLAKLGGQGDGWPVFARIDGSIVAFKPLSRQMVPLGRIAPGMAARASLAAADLDGDGVDEVLYAAFGSAEVQCISPSAKAAPAGWPLRSAGAAFEGLAAATLPGGGAMVCAYDRLRRQFRLFNGAGKAAGSLEAPGPAQKKLVHLSAVHGIDAVDIRFVALFFEPAVEADLDAVFNSRSSPAGKTELERFRKATTASYRVGDSLSPQHQREIDDKCRQYKRSLLVDQYGATRTGRMLDGQPATEAWLLDSTGKALPGTPLRMEGAMPFVDVRGERPCRPALIQEPVTGRVLLLLGGNGIRGAGGKVQLYSLP